MVRRTVSHMSSREFLRNSPDQLSALADRIAIDGFASHAPEAILLADLLDREGFHDVAIDVVRDESQSAIARERAFGILHGIALQAPLQSHLVAA